MANKPLTSEAIAVTEKKMDMTLDDIIKMSKTNPSKSNTKQRASNKNQRPFNGNQDKSLKIRQYLDSRSTVRQGALAQKRTNFQGINFPSTSEIARKAAMAPLHNRGSNRNRAANWNKQRTGDPSRRRGNPSKGVSFPKRQAVQQHPQFTSVMPKEKPKTLDSLFANLKEQRMRAFSQSNGSGGGGGGGARHNVSVANQPRQPWLRGRFGLSRSL